MEGDPFSLVVLDYMMPGMNGAEVGNAIRSAEALEGLPIILLTSLAQRSGVSEANDVGFNAYLVKPVRIASLFDAILLVMSREGEGEAPRRILTETNLPRLTGRRSIRILVAEDNAINQRVAQRTLNKLGFHADVVANGREAIEALKQIPYDLVLMDCQMPELDGFEATRIIRKCKEPIRSLPIVAMTANAMKGDRERCIEAGMNDYLSKPATPKQIEAVILKWLDIDEPGAIGEGGSAPPKKVA